MRDSGLAYAIVRPTLVFGADDVLVNNIAWILRRLPLFILPGDGAYRVQPVAVEDVADLCVDAGLRDADEAFDAAGPETLTFASPRRARPRRRRQPRPHRADAAAARARALAADRPRRRATSSSPREELDGLRAELLVSAEEPRATRSFRRWVLDSGDELGRAYASELGRNYRDAPL